MKVQKFPYDPNKTTVTVAEDWVLNNAAEGVECPCCGQLAKVYRRKLYSSMAYALITIYGAKGDGEGWLHVPSLLNGKGSVSRGGDFAKLVYWGLLEPHKEGKGYYRITARGRDFVECRCAVPAAVFVFDGELLNHDVEQMVTINEALGTKFNYEELMEAAR